MENQQPLLIPNTLIPNPGANPRIEFWLDLPPVWSKKIRYLRVSGCAWRSPAAKLPRCAPAFGKTFSERGFGTLRPDIGLLFG